MSDQRIVLTTDELRAVTSFAVSSAAFVLGVFEAARPEDPRPRAALDSGSVFASGGPRAHAQRLAALAAHRAAKETEGAASHAAMAAGDAAASAYLHPLFDAAQVGHILRASAHSILAETPHGDPAASREEAFARVLRLADPTLIDVLSRYPRARTGRQEVSRVLSELDDRLRASG